MSNISPAAKSYMIAWIDSIKELCNDYCRDAVVKVNTASSIEELANVGEDLKCLFNIINVNPEFQAPENVKDFLENLQ